MGRNQKSGRKTSRRSQPSQSSNGPDILQLAQVLLNPKALTTPREINNDILAFCQTISDFSPFFIEIQPELWARQSCCDLNVEEYIRRNSGKIVCGYKIWYNDPKYIEAERHAVWTNGTEFRDPTFNADGEQRILFLPDRLEKQGSLAANTHKKRWGKDARVMEVVRMLNDQERFFRFQTVSPEEQWNTMLTYEQWLTGKRMSNIQVKKL